MVCVSGVGRLSVFILLFHLARMFLLSIIFRFGSCIVDALPCSFVCKFPVRKPTFLTLSASLKVVVWYNNLINFYNYFLYPPYVTLLLRLQHSSYLFLCSFLLLVSLSWFVAYVVDCAPEIRQANSHRTPIEPLCLLLRENLPIMTPRPVVWVPRWIIFRTVIISRVVFCVYTKPNGCLLSSLLEQILFSYNILILDRAVNQETGASGRKYRNITLTCGHGWIQCRCVRPQEAGGYQKFI